VPILLVSRYRVMINRDSWGNTISMSGVEGDSSSLIQKSGDTVKGDTKHPSSSCTGQVDSSSRMHQGGEPGKGRSAGADLGKHFAETGKGHPYPKPEEQLPGH